MTATVFVDTNVFLYALDRVDLKKQQAAREWREELWKSGRGRVSFQVLHEFYVRATRKWPDGRDETRAEEKDLLAWDPVALGATILEPSWKLQDRNQLSFRGALIVGAAKSIACQYLLTEDLQTNQDLDGVRVINPFSHRPEFAFRRMNVPTARELRVESVDFRSCDAVVSSPRAKRPRKKLSSAGDAFQSIRNLFLFFPCVDPSDICYYRGAQRSVVVKQLAAVGWALVRTNSAPWLSRFGSPYPRFSSWLSADRWNSFKCAFQLVHRHGNFAKSDRVFRCCDFDFRVVRAEIRCLTTFSVCLYSLFARCVLRIHVLLRPIVHVVAMAPALACVIANGDARTKRSDRPGHSAFCAPLDSYHGLRARVLAAGPQSSGCFGARIPGALAWIQRSGCG